MTPDTFDVNWVEFLSLLALSASLNFGFAAFSQIRSTAYEREMTALQIAKKTIWESNNAGEEANTQDNFDSMREMARIKVGLDKVETTLVNERYKEIRWQMAWVVLTFFCGIVATALLVFATYWADYTVDRNLGYVAVATNVGWMLFLFQTIISFFRIWYSVRLPRGRMERDFQNMPV